MINRTKTLVLALFAVYWLAVVFQVVVGLIQFVIALAMLAGYRKTGVWGAF